MRLDCPSFRITLYERYDSELSPVYAGKRASPDRPVDDFEIEFFTENCPGRAVIDGVEYPLLRGTFLCAKPGQRRWSYLPIHGCYHVLLRTDNAALDSLLRSLPVAGVLTRIGEVPAIFQDMLKISDPNSLPSTLALQSCVCRLIDLLTDNVRNGDFPHQNRLLESDRFIRTHLSEELTLPVLARQANLSVTYFHKLFTEFFGKTPTQYVLDLRIAAAKAELLNCEATLSSTAGKCGFSSQAYFGYKFKQVTGQTPIQYQRAMRSTS